MGNLTSKRESSPFLVACNECDAINRIDPTTLSTNAHCSRCGSLVYRGNGSVEKALAFSIASCFLFVLSNCFPLLTLRAEGGLVQQCMFLSGSWEFFHNGMPMIGLLVFGTTFLFPSIYLLGLTYVLSAFYLGKKLWSVSYVFKVIIKIQPWSLLGIFMLGVLLSLVKLLDVASVVPGISIFSFAALLCTSLGSYHYFEPLQLYKPKPLKHEKAVFQRSQQLKLWKARDLNLSCCPTCQSLEDDLDIQAKRSCSQCPSPMLSRKPYSLQRTLAFVITAVILLIPANLYPVMTFTEFGSGRSSTIMGGVLQLLEDGLWPLGIIVFFASIAVPISKLILLTYLVLSVHFKSCWRARDRTKLYQITEMMGAWSMVDIYLLGMLIAVVKFGILSTVLPEVGGVFFAIAVVVMMLASSSFDPRLIWDNLEKNG